MKALPLFYFPTTCAWVDDDETFLNTMTQVYNKKRKIFPFDTSEKCIEFIDRYESPLSKYHFLQGNIEDENYELPQRAPLDFDISKIAEIANDSDRFDVISVIIIDYTMPEINGFELAKHIKNSSIQKILLTGSTQEKKAIEGFNDNLIHKFIQKAEPEMALKIEKYLDELSLLFFQKISSALLSYLETEHKLPQSDPTFMSFFENFCLQNDIQEYYFIDKNGSYLCINSKGEKLCLIIYSDKQIDNWLELNADSKKTLGSNLEDVQERKKLPFFGIGKESWPQNESELDKYFYPTKNLVGREEYYYCTVVI